MKSILMSIQPKWVAKILNGEKTIEVRKRFPLDYRGWVYIYCTKGNKSRYNRELLRKYENVYLIDKIDYKTLNQPLNGKVVARFYCDNVEEIGVLEFCGIEMCHSTESCKFDLYEKSRLSEKEMHTYLNGSRGYAIHISQLEIFDKPKELSEFYRLKAVKLLPYPIEDGGWCVERVSLTKAPQSYMFVEVE